MLSQLLHLPDLLWVCVDAVVFWCEGLVVLCGIQDLKERGPWP